MMRSQPVHQPLRSLKSDLLNQNQELRIVNSAESTNYMTNGLLLLLLIIVTHEELYAKKKNRIKN